MNLCEFEKIIVNDPATVNGRICLESGMYDGKGATLNAPAGIEIASSGVYLKNLIVNGSITVERGAYDVAIQNCTVVANDVAIASNGVDVVIRGNKIICDGVAVMIGAQSENCLVAQNDTNGKIIARGADNCSFILNRASLIDLAESEHIYSVDNVTDSLSVCNISYLICDGNTYGEINFQGNEGFNGNDVTDVDVRLSVGANEDILPHTDRDLFVGMKRKQYVRDITVDGELGLNEYVRHCAENSDVVILPPGAYSVKTCVSLKSEHANTTVYAYGVYEEYSDYGRLLVVDEADNVNIYGLQMGYTIQPSGQIYVLEKLGERRARVVTAAGYMNDFGKSNTDFFSSSFMDMYRSGEMYNWTHDFYETIEHNDDGTMTITFKFQDVYDNTRVGDIGTCRIKAKPNHNNTSVTVCNNAKNVVLRDCVLYGYSAGLAVVLENGRSENVWLDRFHNTVHTGALISKATYDFYRSLEEKYGAELEVYIDEKGRYRGGLSRVGSCDATHIFAVKQGICCRSCLFENMTDDGNNQRSNSARLSELIDNGDGTTTLIYKSNIAQWYYNNLKFDHGFCCMPFVKGDTVYSYAPDGRTVCETDVLSDSEPLDNINFTLTYNGEERACYARRVAVKVRTEDVDFDAVSKFDLTDNRYEWDNKVIVDNVSRNSANFIFDNVLIKNTRSRAMLVKTRGARISNCTFKNMACAGILMTIEPEWGESSVARDIVFKRCLFENIGYHNNMYLDRLDFAPIVIKNFSTAVSENTLQGRDITVDECKFTNIPHHYAIIVHAAQNVRITNNTFDSIVGETADNVGTAVDIDMAMNVEISGNKYLSPYVDTPVKAIKARNNKNVYGTDISDENGNSLIPDNLPE